jgi:hypothetical protein
LRTSSGSSEPLLLRSTTIGDAVLIRGQDKAAGAFIFGGHQFDGFTGTLINLDGAHTDARIQTSGGETPRSDLAATFAAIVKNGAQLRVDDAAAFEAGTFQGSTSDFDLDGDSGAGFNWSDVDADPEKILNGVLTSAIFQER